ncbi:16S rRNA (uracil(1498)-N(3))-methyltransferase [candidate division KSB1 bacterium]|nr:16S rRNA (uracil(1498)-N(3))-methyltransferase [candidate division KSB1 bacterium]RQW07166.1 MAG: 16S rRNA (uracil(1498)-N(3))-methyltransferase [candidate division KSB1 bacterium]
MRTDFQHFYVTPEHIYADSFVLTDDECRHAHVLRKKEGDSIAAIDGCGGLYQGFIRHMTKNRLTASLEQVEKEVGEPTLHLTIVQAVAKGASFDLVIEKGTEIGVSVFQPVLTQRSIVDPTSRIERWRHKALAATKQCGRSRCPDIRLPQTFERILYDNNFDIAFIAHEKVDAAQDITQARNYSNIAIFIGPEGGFTADEIKMAMDAHLFPIHLGKRRLRSETAALVAAIKILSAANELG